MNLDQLIHPARPIMRRTHTLVRFVFLFLCHIRKRLREWSSMCGIYRRVFENGP